MNDGRKFIRKIALGLAPVFAVVALWCVFFSPLPAGISDSIPFTAHHVSGSRCLGAPVPGDHLQLLYHFQLLKDTLSGNSPLFHNVYEFNTGDDSERINPDPGYIPFSLVFAAVSGLTESDALGWNIAQLSAVICAFWLLYLLAFRYSGKKTPAFLSAVTAMCVPYQWVNLAVGSPSGFGMAMVPLVILGLDIAVRDGKTFGGVLAGLGMLFCYTSDLHCFFFIVLFAPVWCVVAAAARDSTSILPDRPEIYRWLKSLWPALIAGIISMGIAAFVKTLYASTAISGGRDASEVIPNSPVFAAIFGLVKNGSNLHFRIGTVIIISAVCIVFGIMLAGLSRKLETQPHGAAVRRPVLLAILFFICIAGIICLGLGFNGPFNGIPIRAARKFLPPYGMIRQPVKILVLMPTVLAPLFAFGFSSFFARRRALSSVVASLVAVAAVVETARAFRTALNTLPEANGAYTAVAAAATSRGVKPHALVIPIWPGDSTWSSLYEYYAMKSHVRMLNGYAPVRSPDYDENVFKKYESITQGRLTDEQADSLLESGVTSIILHETAFPDNVSPLPVAYTLDALRRHPRLKTIARDGGVWAFEIHEVSVEKKPIVTNSAVYDDGDSVREIFPAARVWRVGDGSRALGETGGNIRFALRSPVWTGRGDCGWIFRCRGVQSFSVEQDCSYKTPDFGQIVKISGSGDSAADGFTWESCSLPEDSGDWLIPHVEAVQESGNVSVADAVFGYGSVTMISKGTVTIPANRMFRSGYAPWSEEYPDSVFFRSGFDAAEVLMYGPNLPFEDGKWTVEVEGEFQTEDDAVLYIYSGKKEIASANIGTAGSSVSFAQTGRGLISFNLAYSGKSDVRIDRIVAKSGADE